MTSNTATITLFVYLDCDWLGGPVLMGRLYGETLRGATKVAFEFDRLWLRRFPNLQISADLQAFPGRQYVQDNKEIFAFLTDSMPDRWGRILLNRREQVQAKRENRHPKALGALDQIIGIDDVTRVGALRFKLDPSAPFLNSEDALSVPPITTLRDLSHAARAIETSERKNCLPEEKWLLQLIKPGSSLGGARPKATVIDDDGSLWIAKFPSVNDSRDIGAWEKFAYAMAEISGIRTADSRLLSIDGPHHVFLVRRFDRNPSGRMHFASALTLLGLRDGDGAANGYGYLDIVDAILNCCVCVEKNLAELYRRVAFYICIGNADDHFRNHGFLLTAKGWTLAPAYDLNPTLSRRQSLLINDRTDEADLDVLRNSADAYMLRQSQADKIIDEVLAAMKRWRQMARKLNLAPHDAELFSDRFITG